MNSENITYAVAFAAGLITFLSPCLLPLIPSFIAYITGVSFGDLKDASKRAVVMRKTISHALLFILGFSVIFVLLGLTATFIGKALFQYQKYIRIGGGILIIIFGLYLAGIIKLDFLIKERRLNITAKGATYLGSFLIGVTFAAAWTPCAGPILGSILVRAGTKTDVATGAKLLSAYSAGVAVPFLLVAVLINYFLESFKKIQKIVGAINVVGGIFLVIVGILVATDYLSIISAKLLTTFIK